MGQVKQDTSYIPVQNSAFRIGNVHPTWEMHPDWIQALRNLDSYNQWVCEVVLPIAFQWIEENKEAVYKEVSEEFRDDVGVVIEKAFQLVREKQTYKSGAAKGVEMQDRLKQNTFDSERTNPLWQRMSHELDEARRKVRNSFQTDLPNSIRADASSK